MVYIIFRGLCCYVCVEWGHSKMVEAGILRSMHTRAREVGCLVMYISYSGG
jgi:hypothetical protein